MKFQPIEKPFQIILALVLGLTAFGLWLKVDELLYVGLGIGALALLWPMAGAYMASAWMALGKGLGWINGKILLSVVFFIFLVPIALIYRWTRKNPLHLKNKDDSLFIERNHTYAPKDLKDAW